MECRILLILVIAGIIIGGSWMLYNQVQESNRALADVQKELAKPIQVQKNLRP